MKHNLTLFTCAFVLLSLVAPAQDRSPAPKYEMTTFYLVLFLRGPAWSEPAPERERWEKDHKAYIGNLLNSGKGIVSGPLMDQGPMREVLVVNAGSLEDAKALVEADTAVVEGRLTAEIHPWYAAKNIFKKPEPSSKPTTYYFGLLLRGPGWTPDRTPETERIQKEHMAHLNKTAESGKLVIAGPLTDNGRIRGILVYKTESLDEARGLAEADPAARPDD